MRTPARSTEDEFRVNYYHEADFSHWLKKIEHSARRVATLRRDGSKKGYLLDIYSSYLQLIEILLINMYANSDEGFARRLFVSNLDLRKYFTKFGSDESFIEWFLLGYNFGIEEKSSINDFEQKYAEHREILREVIDDYLKDFEFLNAYKHGFRVLSSSGSHTIAIDVGGATYKLGEFDTLLTYFSKDNRKDERGKVVGIDLFENSIMVNIRRTVIKAIFITAMLDNMRLVIAATNHERGIALNHYRLMDKTVWRESYGSFRSKEFMYYTGR